MPINIVGSNVEYDVTLATAQTISGQKTFTATPIISSATPGLRFNDVGNASGISSALWQLDGGQFKMFVDTTNSGNWDAVSPITVNADRSVTFAAGVFDGANRVYSATNPPPPAVSSVAGRSGAVVLTAADVAGGTFGAGAFTFPAALTATAGTATFGTVVLGSVTGGTGMNVAGAALEVAETAASAITPRIAFNRTGGGPSSQLGIDTSGHVRTYNALGDSYEAFRAGNLFSHDVLVSPVIPIPFHIGGTVPVALSKAKFIAPMAMTLRSAYWLLEAGTVTFAIAVNGTIVAQGASVTAAATATNWDFTDVNINAGDRVQVQVTASTATTTELSLTINAVGRV